MILLIINIRVLLKDDKLIVYIIYRIKNDVGSELFKICIKDFYRHKG